MTLGEDEEDIGEEGNRLVGPKDQNEEEEDEEELLRQAIALSLED